MFQSAIHPLSGLISQISANLYHYQEATCFLIVTLFFQNLAKMCHNGEVSVKLCHDGEARDLEKYV